jgi:hypothetical protein
VHPLAKLVSRIAIPTEIKSRALIRIGTSLLTHTDRASSTVNVDSNRATAVPERGMEFLLIFERDPENDLQIARQRVNATSFGLQVRRERFAAFNASR